MAEIAMEMSDHELQKDVLSKFKLPCRFEEGYIFDSNNQMMAEIRAWGYLTDYSNACELQDKLGQMFANSFNIMYEAKVKVSKEPKND